MCGQVHSGTLPDSGLRTKNTKIGDRTNVASDETPTNTVGDYDGNMLTSREWLILRTILVCFVEGNAF